MGLILDRAQLCEALGVSDSAISAWEKKGLPTVRRGRGRGMKSLYDLDQVRAWCADTGYGHSTSALLARFARAEPPPAPPGPPPAPVQTSGLSGDALWGLRAWWAMDSAFMHLPAIAAAAGVSETQLDALIAGMLRAMEAELVQRGVQADAIAEIVGAERDTIAEERARPGSWTT
jgi:hypothetical protein